MSSPPNYFLSTVLQEAAKRYAEWGWVAHPLTNDAQGFPKRPFVNGWQLLRVEDVPNLPWKDALGLGLVLGEASSNLAVIDLDDVELAEAAFAVTETKARSIRTIRNRGHIYVTEATVSRSSAITVQWKGRSIKVELKAQGTQVAAPPTPSYRHVNAPDMLPVATESVRFAWQALAHRLGVVSDTASTEAPETWQPLVQKDHRNNTLYVEAHKLREAGMGYEQAVEILRLRWEHQYEQGGMGWLEVERTIKSAYRKPVPEATHGRDAYNLWTRRQPRNADRPSDSPGLPDLRS